MKIRSAVIGFCVLLMTGCPFLPGPSKGVLGVRVTVEKAELINAETVEVTIKEAVQNYSASKTLDLLRFSETTAQSAFYAFQYVPEGSWTIAVVFHDANKEKVLEPEAVIRDLKAGENGSFQMVVKNGGGKALTETTWSVKQDLKPGISISGAESLHFWERSPADGSIEDWGYWIVSGKFQNLLGFSARWPDGVQQSFTLSRTAEAVLGAEVSDTEILLKRRDYHKGGKAAIRAVDVNDLAEDRDFSLASAAFSDASVPEIGTAELRENGGGHNRVQVDWASSETAGVKSFLAVLHSVGGAPLWQASYLGSVAPENSVTFNLDEPRLEGEPLGVTVISLDRILTADQRSLVFGKIRDLTEPEEIFFVMADLNLGGSAAADSAVVAVPAAPVPGP